MKNVQMVSPFPDPYAFVGFGKGKPGGGESPAPAPMPTGTKRSSGLSWIFGCKTLEDRLATGIPDTTPLLCYWMRRPLGEIALIAAVAGVAWFIGSR